MHRYVCWNGPAPTAAVQASVLTTTTIRTMLQIATPSTRQCQVLAWGYDVDALQNGVIELLQTDVAATVTAHVASGFVKIDPNAPDTLMSLGAAASGYTATAEGTITATRVFDSQQVLSISGQGLKYSRVFTPAERPIIAVSKFLRVRAAFLTTQVALRCWVEISE